jgi:hypothetical protein
MDATKSRSTNTGPFLTQRRCPQRHISNLAPNDTASWAMRQSDIRKVLSDMSQLAPADQTRPFLEPFQKEIAKRTVRPAAHKTQQGQAPMLPVNAQMRPTLSVQQGVCWPFVPITRLRATLKRPVRPRLENLPGRAVRRVPENDLDKAGACRWRLKIVAFNVRGCVRKDRGWSVELSRVESTSYHGAINGTGNHKH